MGYHLKEIKKGEFGEFSKIREEMEELLDAHEQNNRVLEIVELTDLLGAIEAYVRKNNLTLSDLISMMELTKKAFKDGDRK
jgi:phosphoribosyl-ATP pyrophosphohydrolase